MRADPFMSSRENGKKNDSKIRELEKSRLDEKAKMDRMLVLLETRTEQLALVTGIIKKLISGMELPELLNIFGKYVKTLCPYDRVDVSIYNEATDQFDIPFVLEGGKVTKNVEYPRPYKSTVIHKVVEENKPLLRSDIRKEFQFDTDQLFVKRGYTTEMIFPLDIGGKVVGTFDIACLEPGRLNQRHMEILGELMPAFSLAVYFFLQKKKKTG